MAESPEEKLLRVVAERDTAYEALNDFGGYLRCGTCGATQPLGNASERLTRAGWPKCCGYTMTWLTQRQIDAGEVSGG